jgi:hypothetical protein
MVDWATKDYFEKTSKQGKIQENDMSQKCSFSQSQTPQNQHWKSEQDLVKKKQNTKSQTQVCV